MTLIVTLIVLNIPVYFLLGWIMFDSTHDAANSFGDTLIAILKAIFVPQIVRVLMDDEEDNGASLFNTFFFFLACIAAVGGEYYLLTKYVWPVE